MEYYDKQYDRVTTKNEKRMKRIDRVFHKVTTTDDPIIRQVPAIFFFYQTFASYDYKIWNTAQLNLTWSIP